MGEAVIVNLSLRSLRGVNYHHPRWDPCVLTKTAASARLTKGLGKRMQQYIHIYLQRITHLFKTSGLCITQLAKMSISNLKLVELTPGVFIMFL